MSIFKKFICVSAALALAGCATCERHPYICSVAGALVVGSIAATIQANDSQHRAYEPNKATTRQRTLAGAQQQPATPYTCVYGGWLDQIEHTLGAC